MLKFPEINPVAFELGPIAIHWYGISYMIGILFSWWYAKKLIGKTNLWAHNHNTLKPEHIDDLLTWIPIGIIFGGRLGYILFYDFMHFLQNPLKIFAIWEGGMSFHGGALGVLLILIFFSRVKKINLLSTLDTISATAPFGIGIVRCANFINGELWGRVSNVPWAFVFPGAGSEPRHPSQLYEAFLEGLILFIFLRLLTHRYKKLASAGFISGCFIAFYGCVRTALEWVREPDIQLGYLAGEWLTMGMILSLPMIFSGIMLMILAKPIHKKP